MIAGIRSLSRPLNRAMNSKRTKLSGSTIELVTALLAGLGPSFEPLASIFFLSLLGLCAHTNKVLARRAKACVFAVIRDTQSQSLLPYLAESLHHKLTSVRIVAAEGVLAHLNCFTPSNIENDSRRARLLENVMKLTSRDVSMDVRQLGKKISEAHKAQLADCSERCVSNVSARDDIVSRVPFSSLGSVTPVTKKVAVQGTAPPRVLSRDHKTTGITRTIVPLVQKVDSAEPSELPRDICAVKPIATSKQATSAHQGTLRPPAVPGPSQLCARVIIPTAPLPKNDSTETTRAPRHRRNGPPPFKPISRTRCLISTSDPQNLMPVPTVRPSSRIQPVAKTEHPVTGRMNSQVETLRGQLMIEDLKLVVKALSGGMENADNNRSPLRPSPTACSTTAPLPSSPAPSAQSGKFESAVSGGDSTIPGGEPPVRATAYVLRGVNNIDATRSRCDIHTSTTPKGEPPVRITAHIPRGVNRPNIKATSSRLHVEDSTSTVTTPKVPTTWPIHCDDLFAPSSHDAYVPPMRVSERLTKVERLLTYHLTRDCPPTLSPCIRDSHSTSSKTSFCRPTPIDSSHQAPLLPSRVPFEQWLASWTSRLDACINILVV